ncbi:MAG: sulfatase [Candidatus Krumholzibacteriia bacterium]
MTRIRGLRLAGACLALLIPLSIFPSGCGRSDRPPSVILVVMDTLRADHLGCYGYARPTSPRIDAFAAGATLYERAYATAPWTVPSHGSLFTGLLPFKHGAHTYKDGNGQAVVAPLDRDHVTLAEVFAGAGYRTGGFVGGNAFLSERLQFDQGFATYVVVDEEARSLVPRVLAWIDAAPADPFFVFINVMDTHRVYNTTPRPDLLAEPAVRDQGQLLDRLYEAVMPGDQPVPAALAQQVIDQYDTAVANLDEQIGVLLDGLRDRGLDDHTVVVLTADHGEYFGEHHLVEHSKDVYEPAVRVPLLIGTGGAAGGRRVAGCRSLADVPALIFEQMPADLAADRPASFRRIPGSDPIVVENYYSRRKDLEDLRWGRRFDRVRTAIYDWPYKLIRSSDGAHELYRLDADPTESTNLADEERTRVTELTDRLKRIVRGRGRYDKEPRPEPLTRREQRRLRSLGYIGR